MERISVRERNTVTTDVPVANGGYLISHGRTLVMLAATALGIYLCYRLALPFLPALVWALTLAVVFAPFNRWLESRLVRPNLAAGVSVLVIGLIVVVPATFVGQRLVLQAARGAQSIQERVESRDWRRAIEARPRIAFIVDTIEQQIDLSGTVQTLATWMTNTATAIVKGSVLQGLGVLLTFYLLFFFIRDRRAAILALRSLSPLSELEMDRLLDRTADTIVATVYGTLAVSAVQGLLGGLMFWWLGLPAPMLWGAVMAILAVLPVLGAFVVWAPAALFLTLDGCFGKALILTLWGLIVVGGIDNLLRPLLSGNRLKLHTVLAFMSVVGGLVLFGSAGLILGPVVLTVTMVLLEIWSARTAATAAEDERSPHAVETFHPSRQYHTPQ
jgi:predicted PurR-regulated permease PerM